MLFWHSLTDAVLADKHSGNKNRTTVATKVLKDVKQEYKESHSGRARTLWYAAAYAEYKRRVEALFPDIPSKDCGLILVQRTAKVVESGRIIEGKRYGYPGREAIYGPACNPKAVNFFFQSRDPPTLENEVRRLGTSFNDLRQSPEQPPLAMMGEFEDLLQFIDRKISAPPENLMARELLENIKFIPVLQKQWKLLKEHTRPVASVACPTHEAIVKTTKPVQEQAQRHTIKKATLERISTENSDDVVMSYLAPLLCEEEGEEMCNEVAQSDVMESYTLSPTLDRYGNHIPRIKRECSCHFECPPNPSDTMFSETKTVCQSMEGESRIEQLQTQVEDLQRMVQQLLLNHPPSSASLTSDFGKSTTRSQRLGLPSEIKVDVQQSIDDTNTS